MNRRASARSQTGRYRISPLTPDSPDEDARADASNPDLTAELAASARRARASDEWVSQQEMEAKDLLTAEEEAEAAALLKEWEAQDRASHVIENASVRPAPGERRPTRRPSGRRPTATGEVSGRLVVRFPRSIYRALAARAGDEGVSLNQLVVAYVSRCLGAPDATARP
jgi:hypothetical protein